MPPSAWSARALLVIALLLFGLPLFIGLGGADMENDEAIYSYSVERMLALHDWLTPRAIYDGADRPFLEKPPLKIWVVAAGQLAGLPRDESGLRFFDPLFAVFGFAYVFALGRRLAGPLCGFVALLVLFTFQPLVFEHGLRTNNMESAMLLTYCGGVYHVFRWLEDADVRQRRPHAWATAGFFAFGFLMKFVAAALLPIVAVAAMLWRRDAAARVRTAAVEYFWPAVAALAAIAPWFLYQSARRGGAFWNEIFGRQVFTRFTAALDPNHVRPWHYYVVASWKGFAQSGDVVLTVAGLGWLLIAAWRGRPAVARILLLWSFVPFAVISTGTSKLIHYMYPFIPPIALGAGAGAAAWMDFWNARSRPWQPRLALQHVAAAIGLALLLLAVWTLDTGPLTWTVFGVRVLRVATPIRPLVLGVLALCAAGSIRAAIRVAAIVALAAALPAAAYAAEWRQLSLPHRPLHAIRECALAQSTERGLPLRGVYGPSWSVVGHAIFYYFRSLGPYHTAMGDDDDMRARLFQPGRQTPVILPRAAARRPFLTSIEYDGTFVVALPGPFETCAADAVAAGGQIAHIEPAAR